MCFEVYSTFSQRGFDLGLTARGFEKTLFFFHFSSNIPASPSSRRGFCSDHGAACSAALVCRYTIVHMQPGGQIKLRGGEVNSSHPRRAREALWPYLSLRSLAAILEDEEGGGGGGQGGRRNSLTPTIELRRFRPVAIYCQNPKTYQLLTERENTVASTLDVWIFFAVISEGQQHKEFFMICHDSVTRHNTWSNCSGPAKQWPPFVQASFSSFILSIFSSATMKNKENNKIQT